MMKGKVALRRGTSLLLALVMMFSLCMTTSAEGVEAVESSQALICEQTENLSEATTEDSVETVPEQGETESSAETPESAEPVESEQPVVTPVPTEDNSNESTENNGVDSNGSNIPMEENAEPDNSLRQTSDEIIVSDLNLIDRNTNTPNAVVGPTAQQSFSIVTTVDGPEKTSVWLGYRFSIPEKSASGGTYSFVSGSYSWLQALDSDTTPKVTRRNGQLIIEGKVENKTVNGTVVPGLFTNSIGIANSNLVNNETAILTVESWVIDAEETSKKTATATITAQTESKYHIVNDGIVLTISGYYNQTTGDFSLTQPANMDGYVYGRVCRFVLYAWPENGTERLDPTKPISFDFSYDLIKRQNGQNESETDSAYQPLLLAVKQCNTNVTESQLEGTPPIKDYTLGGLLPDNSNNNGPYNTPYYRGGDYTFSRDVQDDNKIHVSAVISKDNKDQKVAGWNTPAQHAAIQGLVFVPLKEDDPSDLQRILKITAGNIAGTSYSGLEIQDTTPENCSKQVTIPQKNIAIPQKGLFSRSITFRKWSWEVINQVGINGYQRIDARITNNRSSTISDYQINAINILVKVRGDWEISSVEYGDGGYTGAQKARNVLYAVKPDGTSWNDDVELNYTEDQDLLYYDSKAEAAQHGKIVGVLFELRGGIWSSGDTINEEILFYVRETNGATCVCVQDVKVWRGEAYTTSWAGSNGTTVAHTVDPTDKMVPYDNPKYEDASRKDKIYHQDIWEDGAVSPKEIDSHVWGDTVYVVGGLLERMRDKGESTVLNGDSKGSLHGAWNEGWPSSTYNLTENQRIADRVVGFKISGVGDRAISLKARLDAYNYMTGTNIDYLEQRGKVYLSTKDNPVTYTPNPDDPALPGTFTGGIEIDPNNFTVPGDGEYQIYYSSYIGNAEDLSKDAPNGAVWNESTISVTGNSAKYVRQGNTTVAYVANITRTGTKSIDKFSISEIAENTAAYDIAFTSQSTGESRWFLLDVLPYNGDGRGTSYNGSYTLQDDKVSIKYSSLTPDELPECRLFYTTDNAVQGKDSTIFSGKQPADLADGFTAGDCTWYLATHNDDKSWSLPADTSPTALMLCGKVNENERVTMQVRLALSGQHVGDTYCNTATALLVESTDPLASNTATVTVAGRTVSGKAWEDKNKNGLYDDGELLLTGVSVELYKADGTRITESVGNQFSYTGIKTDSSGTYCFNGVPENADGYYVVFRGSDSFVITNYKATDKNKSGAVTPDANAVDSDINGIDATDQSAKTDVFKLLTNAEMEGQGITNQTFDGVNAGFIRHTASLEVTKTVEGELGNLQKEFSFTVTLGDTSINGTYGEMVFANGVANFTLKHGQIKKATGLPAGITYKVTETPANGYDTMSTGASGTLPAGGTATAAFTNTRRIVPDTSIHEGHSNWPLFTGIVFVLFVGAGVFMVCRKRKRGRYSW